ncbi:MAG: YceI family protein [Saprospiraceae bacterium]|nr:YceI family protein [Saprospiraceae bacterium]
MKKLVLFAFVFGTFLSATAQKFYSKDAKVSFDATSKTSPEKIAALNPKGTIVIDAATGKMEAAVLVTGFHFEQALMEEHFNENYMESTKFAKATFAGEVVDFKKTVNLAKEGEYTATVKGKLTMHGVTKDVETKGIFTVKGSKVTVVKASFKAPLADYKVAIPKIVSDKIAVDAKIYIAAAMLQLK